MNLESKSLRQHITRLNLNQNTPCLGLLWASDSGLLLKAGGSSQVHTRSKVREKSLPRGKIGSSFPLPLILRLINLTLHHFLGGKFCRERTTSYSHYLLNFKNDWNLQIQTYDPFLNVAPFSAKLVGHFAYTYSIILYLFSA